MSCLTCIIKRKFSRAKFLRFEVDPQTNKKFGTSKICRYTVDTYTHIQYLRVLTEVHQHSQYQALVVERAHLHMYNVCAMLYIESECV